MYSSSVRRAVALVYLTAAMSVAGTPALAAGGWRAPVGALDVVLPYGESFVSAGGTVCTHRGLDLGAAAGASVSACADGEVSFAGPVPTEAGGRTLAVTVTHSDGLRTTYLPLAGCDVVKGETVAAGDRVGSLATEGDGSSASTHLHVSVRRGEAYLDPAAFLTAPTSSAPESGGGSTGMPGEAGATDAATPVGPTEGASVGGTEAAGESAGPVVEIMAPTVTEALDVPTQAGALSESAAMSEPSGILGADYGTSPSAESVAGNPQQTGQVSRAFLLPSPEGPDALVAAAAALVALTALFAACRRATADSAAGGVVPVEVE